MDFIQGGKYFCVIFLVLFNTKWTQVHGFYDEFSELRFGSQCFWIRCRGAAEGEKCPESYGVTATKPCRNQKPGNQQVKCCPRTTGSITSTSTTNNPSVPSSTTTTVATPTSSTIRTTITTSTKSPWTEAPPAPALNPLPFPFICQSPRNAFPYQVALVTLQDNQNTLDHFCDGVIISANLILTSAWCALSEDKENVLVLAGMTNLNTITKSGQIKFISEVFIHQDYKPSRQFADLALLFIDSEFSFADPQAVAPVTFSNSAYSTGLISGWVEGRNSESEFHEVPTVVVEDYFCERRGEMYLYFYYDPASQICVPGQIIPESCHGLKKGGPLSDSNSTIVHGIFSGTLQYDEHFYPALVFTDLVYFQDWIHQNLIWNDYNNNIRHHQS